MRARTHRMRPDIINGLRRWWRGPSKEKEKHQRRTWGMRYCKVSSWEATKTEERLKASIVAIRDCGRLRLQFIGYQHATQCRFWSRRCTGNYD